MGSIDLHIVEDDLILANDLKEKLTDTGYAVLGIDTKGETAVENIEKWAKKKKLPDIVIMDVKLAGKMNGIEAAKKIVKKHNCGIIFLTALNKKEVFKNSFALKPFSLKKF